MAQRVVACPDGLLLALLQDEAVQPQQVETLATGGLGLRRKALQNLPDISDRMAVLPWVCALRGQRADALAFRFQLA